MAMLLTNRPNQIFDPAKVEDIAAKLTADDCDGWQYRAKHDPNGTGGSVIEVYDENGKFVELF